MKAPLTKTERGNALFAANQRRVWRHTDRMFVDLMLFEWAMGIVLALWFSPRTWAGASSSVHPHVLAAVFFGGAITLFPVGLARYFPGAAFTRQAIALGQTLMSSLLIHVMGGRIEAHFHIFGSLAFLAFYRDWRVLATATAVIVADHYLRGNYWSQSIFGTPVVSQWRWLEHAAYVIFEDIFLLLSIRQSLRGSAEDAGRRAALQMLYANIENQVASRTAELTAEISERKRVETELASARDAALAAVRMKSQFLANMSHEIRTPMNGVMGMSDLLLDTRLDRDQREFAETIRHSGDLLLTVINDILDFSKIEAGKLTFETLDFELREVTESTLEMLAEKAQTRGLELLGHIGPEVPTSLRGDPGRLRQVLTNLLNNGIKFTEHGEVSLWVFHEADHDGGALLRFEIRDTGIGISPEAQQQLFQAFNQADNSTTRKYGGTGLGLAIARQLVGMMHGEIGARSVPGQGSTFWFTARFARQLTPVPVRRRDTETLAGSHLLIVDDNATNRKILQLQLASLRMRCSAVASGAEALVALRAQAAAGDPFDLAILDMQMPEMDGLMLADAIKAEPALARTLLVMLSSLGDQMGEAFRAHGIEEYLVKPVKQSRLYDCLANVMHAAEMQHPAAGENRSVPPAATARPEWSQCDLRILLAEDNAVNQKVAIRQLQKLGYRADVVGDGLEVMEALGRIPYDLILMDCQMPQLDGYDTTRRIRREHSRPIHIIAMTAHALEGDREKCLAAGMDDYLNKPVRTGELQAALERRQPLPSDAASDDRLHFEPPINNGDPMRAQELVQSGV